MMIDDLNRAKLWCPIHRMDMMKFLRSRDEFVCSRVGCQVFIPAGLITQWVAVGLVMPNKWLYEFDADSLAPEVPGVESGVSAGLSPTGETIVTKAPEAIFTTEAVDRKSLLQLYANLRPAQRSRVRVEVHPDVWGRMMLDPQLVELMLAAEFWTNSLFGHPVEIKEEPGLTLRLVVDAP
jgi:hypothetical protein